MFIRKLYKILIAIGLISSIGLTTAFIYLATIDLQNIDVDLDFDEDKAYAYVEDQLELDTDDYRIPGTQGRIDCMNYFIDHFLEIDSDFSYEIHNFSVEGVDCQNVLFKLNEDKDNIVILGAHYDTRAKATHDLSHTSDPVPGANDGASGCAVLLELASVFYDRRSDLDCQIWFLFFDAEDQGNDGKGYAMAGWEFCEGSNAFVDDIEDFYDSDDEDFDCMILLDMVGGTNLKFINELNSDSSLLDELFQTGQQLGYTHEFPSLPISERIYDDHVPFDSICPIADLIIQFWGAPADWPYWHTIYDNIDHISRNSLEATGETVEQFIYNNYWDPSNEYEGNSPWDEDIDLPSTSIVIIIGSFSAIIAGLVISLYLIKRNALKKVRDLGLEQSDEIKINGAKKLENSSEPNPPALEE